MSDDENMGERILAFLQNKTMGELESYLKRGRELSDVSTESLSKVWIEHFRHWASNPDDASRQQAMADAQAELSLRNVELPFEHVVDEFETMKAPLAARVRSMSEDERHDANTEFVQDLKEFERSAKRSH